MNLGSAGYGTYQSLLALEHYLAEHEHGVDFVIYGFITRHEERNAATGRWLAMMAWASDAGPVGVPFATLNGDGTLARHPPVSYPRWPLRESSATIAALESGVAALATRGRRLPQTELTLALIGELRRVSEAHGARFFVAALANGRFQKATMDTYLEGLAQRETDYIDCRHPKFHDPSTKIPGIGHPNEATNAHWAHCIERRLTSRLRRDDHESE